MHGTFYVTHAVGRRWIAAKQRGNVVSITVTWVRNGSPYVVPSAMSKSAIHAMTMSLAAEWGHYGIRLNTIAPGEIPTEGMSKRIKPGDEAGARTKALNPMGRVGTMEELQNLAVFLISGGCDWINGETIAMDGGQALAMGGNFYQLRDWSDADWNQARASRSRRRTKRTAPRGAVTSSGAPNTVHVTSVVHASPCRADTTLRRTADIVFAAHAPHSRNKTNTSGETCPYRREPANLADMVRARAKTRGNAIAFEFEGRRTSFAEFDINTNRVANALKALGVKPGERIAYLGKNSDIYFELLLGAMKANVVMAPVNWRLAGPEIAFIVEDCKAPVLFVGPEFIDAGPQHPGAIARRAHHHHHRRRRAGMAGFYAPGATRRAATIRKSRSARKDIAIQLYTSGTTGKPKGAMLSHANFLKLVRAGGDERRTGTDGPRTTSRWWRCRSSTSAAPAGACWASITAPRA